MSCKNISIKQELNIDNIISIRYFKSANDFTFEEVSYDFWECLFVMKGEVTAVRDSVTLTLKKDTVLFFPPNGSHRIYPNKTSGSSLLMIGFQCTSPAMDFFRNKTLETGPSEQILLNNIIKEAKLTYSSFDKPDHQKLTRKDAASVPFASEQLIQLYLLQLLIQLIRSNSTDNSVGSIPKSERKRSEEELFYTITAYMEENINGHLTIQQICKDNLIDRSLLQKLFRENTGYSIIDYFSQMKINTAKCLIRDNQMNFTQIAEELGYNSIHYFSRQFKKLTGMSPSEYAASVPSQNNQKESPCR